MNIYVSIDKVEIKQQNKLHEGEYKINKCFFEFSKEYTKNLTSRAIFTTINGAYQETIINNQCDIPIEILKEKGIVELGVYSYEIEEDKLKLRYSPSYTTFSVENGSYKEAKQPEAPSPSEFEKYLYNFNENAVNKTNEFNENANRKITELNKISTDVSNMKNSVEKSEQNTKTSEDNAKASETSAQNSANKALESETNIVNIEKNINAIKEQIDTINTNIDGQVNTVNTLAKNASDQATKAENQAKISTENAAATSADKTAVSEMKSEVEGLKNEAKTSRDEAESFKYETLQAKEVVKNSLENERIESEKRYAKAVDTEVITVEEFAQVELDEDGYMEDVVVEASKEITQEVREGYNQFKNPFNDVITKNGVTLTPEDDKIHLEGELSANSSIRVAAKIPQSLLGKTITFKIFGLEKTKLVNGGFKNKVTGNNVLVVSPNSNSITAEITQDMIDKADIFNFYASIDRFTTINQDLYIQIIEGTEDKPYEAYGVSPSLNSPSEFQNVLKEVSIQNNDVTSRLALPEGQFLGNFKGYSNSIDKGVLKGQLKEVVLTGNESIYNSSNGNIFRISLDTPHLENTSTQVKTDLVKSNYFNNVSYAELNDASVDNGIEIYNNYIQFRDSQIASVEEWKAKLKELYDAGTPVKILYVAQTEEQQELSQENLQVINSLQIYQGENNVSTPEAKLSFKANQGIPSYVDKVIDEKIAENNLSEREISDNKYARALKKEVSETDFIQVFAENEKIEGLEIYGEELTQETREGYNLLDYSSILLKGSGMTAEYSNDGYITMNGTQTSSWPTFIDIDITDLLEDGETYTLWAENTNKSLYDKSFYPVIRKKDSNKNTIENIFISTSNKTFTVDKSAVPYYAFLIQMSDHMVTLTNEKNRFMLYKGTDNKVYELPGAMPSLDYLSEVHTMNDRVNLFDKESVVEGGLSDTGTVLANTHWRVSDYIEVSPLTNYMFSWVSDSAYFQITVAMYKSDKTFLSKNNYSMNNSYAKTFQTISECKYLRIAYSVNVSGTNVTREKIKLEKGTQTSPYSPHGQGSLEVYNGNNNFLPNEAKTQTINGVAFTVNEDGSVLANGTATAQTDLYLVGSATEYISLGTKQGNYILSGCPSNGSSSTYMLLLVPKGKSGMVNSKTPTQITIENGDTFRALIRIMSGVTVSNLLFKPMIRLATDEDDTYVPHQSQTTLIPFPQDTFDGAIGSYKDTIKEVDERWKVEKKLEEYAMTGTENLVIDGTYNGITQFRFTPKVLPLNGLDKISTIMSNCFKGTFYSNSWIRDNTVTVNLSSSFVRFMTSKYSTVEEFKAKLIELYNAGTPVKIYYVINTKYIDLPDETQEILNGIKLRLGLNNFSIDVGTFSYIYNKSLAKELEEKDALIEELASRILALENATLNLAEGE